MMEIELGHRIFECERNGKDGGPDLNRGWYLHVGGQMPPLTSKNLIFDGGDYFLHEMPNGLIVMNACDGDGIYNPADRLILVSGFNGSYEFLSNFYERKVHYNGLTFDNSEAAFQAQKSLDPDIQALFCGIQAGVAKRRGKLQEINGKKLLRSDWEDVKVQVMLEVVHAKFSQNRDLLEYLLDTQEALLVEENWWADVTWGRCKGTGRNLLGQILMELRKRWKIARSGESRLGCKPCVVAGKVDL